MWEKAMAPHSSTLAWKTPWTEEPGGLQSMGSLKSRTRPSDFTFTLTRWTFIGKVEPDGPSFFFYVEVVSCLQCKTTIILLDHPPFFSHGGSSETRAPVNCH